MQEHKIIQGTPKWHEFRAQHLNASDAPAMMGESPYKTRDALLREKATGIIAEVSSETQRRFDDGHRFEALARPLAEKIIGEELYPVVGSNGKFAASFDGMTMLGEVIFEHKTLNAALAAIDPDEQLPLYYRIQMEHQLMVSGAEKCLFMASKWDGGDQLIESRHWWYFPDLLLRQRIVDGWAQFEKDAASYTPPEASQVIVAGPVHDLPAVCVQVDGHVDVRENFSAFEAALRDFLDNKLIREPQTDQEFADLDLQIKAMKKAEAALESAEVMMLAQIQSVDTAKRQKDMLAKLVRGNRLMSEKLVESEKARRKAERVAAAKDVFSAHVAALQSEIADVRLTVLAPDFGVAIKGLKTLVSIDNAIGVAMANAKIAADQQAADVRAKLVWLNENAAEYRALLADLQQLIAKPLDDFKLAVMARIDAHRQAEEARLEAERERIRNEEAEKLAAQAESIKPPPLAAGLAVSLGAALVGGSRFAPSTHADDGLQSMRVATLAPVPPADLPRYKCAGDVELPQPAVDAIDSPPTLKLGEINARLGFTLSADFLAQLGFVAHQERSSRLYHERDWPHICAALIRHIQAEARPAAGK